MHFLSMPLGVPLKWYCRQFGHGIEGGENEENRKVSIPRTRTDRFVTGSEQHERIYARMKHSFACVEINEELSELGVPRSIGERVLSRNHLRLLYYSKQRALYLCYVSG